MRRSIRSVTRGTRLSSVPAVGSAPCGVWAALIALAASSVSMPALAAVGSLAGGAGPAIGATDAAVGAAAAPDALDEALATAGLTRSDLGWEARGWWERYPQDIPYKLRHFDDLLAEPLAIYPFTRAMAMTLVKTLAPENVAGKKGDLGAAALYRAVHDLGVNKRYGGTRAFSANLPAKPTPLGEALLEAWPAGDRRTEFMTFGQASELPALRKDLADACADLPPAVSGILGKLVLDLLEARRWAELGFRNVGLETRLRIAHRIDLGQEMTDAQEYEPAMDDAAQVWDEASLWIAGLKTVEALDLARLALADTLPDVRSAALSSFRLRRETPVGLVIVDGTGGSEIAVPETGAFLVVDLGGDDRYSGPTGGSSPAQSIAAALDLAGDDTFDAEDVALGAGVTGIGVVLDGGGHDIYRAHTMGEGAGHFGMGALIDLEGDDRYEQRFSGQGAGFFGIGILLDLAGADSYTLWGDGQGFGGVAGVGVLADRLGDDVYLAVVDPAVTGRPSGHSDNKISASGAQGCGMGRRGDGSDGHSWAGGLGALLDGEGDDRYTIGNWGQGCGYWFGTGLVWDGAGDDEYRATGWASASGAHFCIGAVIDEQGDDLHAVAQNWGPGFGHDFTVAMLFDGSGNDRYECGGEGVGHSINRSVALALEGGGDYAYVFSMEGKRPGLANFDPRFLDRTGSSVYWTESTSVGLFLDVGGADQYPAGLADDHLSTDEPESDNARAHDRGILVDRSSGVIELDRRHGGHRR